MSGSTSPQAPRSSGSKNDIFTTTSGGDYFQPLPEGTEQTARSRPIAPPRQSASSSNPTLQSSPLTPRHTLPATQPKRKGASYTMKKKLTTSMVKDKLCWICFTSESDPDSASKGRWVHPCKCALFAHESCLLAWIAEYQSRNRRSTTSSVSCPQCNIPYSVKQSNSIALDTFERTIKVWDKMAVRIAIGSVGFGFSSLSYFYGVSACRAFLGPQAFNSIISSPLEPPHPKHFITMPLVAPALVLSRTNLIDALFPLLPLALLNFPPTALYNSGYIKGLRLLRIPSPATTCLLLPFIRHFYLKGRSWIYRKALARQSKKNTLSGAASGMTTPLPETPAPNTPAVHFEAQIVHHHQGDAQHQRQQNRPEAPQQAQEPNPDDLEPGAQVTLSLHRLAGMVVGALVLPFVSAGAGEMLLQVSKSSGILRAVLGLQNEVVWKSAIGSLLPFGGVPQASMDPAWWRNTIGGVLVVMSNDLLKLIRMLLRQKRLDSRKIEEVPIDPSLDVNIVDSSNWRMASS